MIMGGITLASTTRKSPDLSPPFQIQATDSNLQSFPPSQAKGKISSGFGPPRDADETFSKSGLGSDDPQPSGWFSMFNIATYKPYFDVDTSDVLERIKESLFPFRGSFNQKTANNPDLYGPFFICTTLIFVAAAIGTFVTYVTHKLKKEDWNYDINFVTWLAGLFYGYVTVVPLVLYFVLKYFSAPAGFVQLFSVWLLPVHLCSCTVSYYRASGDIQVGGGRYSRIHVRDFCCTESQRSH